MGNKQTYWNHKRQLQHPARKLNKLKDRSVDIIAFHTPTEDKVPSWDSICIDSCPSKKHPPVELNGRVLSYKNLPWAVDNLCGSPVILWFLEMGPGDVGNKYQFSVYGLSTYQHIHMNLYKLGIYIATCIQSFKVTKSANVLWKRWPFSLSTKRCLRATPMVSPKRVNRVLASVVGWGGRVVRCSGWVQKPRGCQKTWPEWRFMNHDWPWLTIIEPSLTTTNQ